MTEKELLYVEDALNHLNDMKTKFESYKENVSNGEIANFINEACNKQEQLFQNFFNLL